ncbi:hypothetical protein ABW21_db0201563 [Orbilia brochopaga]|nr:hypothetical protein ABW21_db0201563 [Drechslerella brochopaga]
MHHARYTGPGRPRFDPPSSWVSIHYMQFIFSILTLTYVAIAANSRTGAGTDSPKYKDIENGWGYYLAIASLSVYPASTIIHWVITTWSYHLTPLDVFITEILVLCLWLVGLAGEIIALISYVNAPKTYSRSVVRTAHGLALSAFIVFAIGSLFTMRAAYRQHREFRATTAKYSRQAESSERFHALTTYDQPVAGHARTESGSSTLTREERIAQNVDAVVAPPTYWYATSNRTRGREDGASGISRPQIRTHDSSDTLPLYRP